MDREYVERITRKLMDDGKLIEAGWLSFRFSIIPLSASPAQIDDMRNSFFAGAQSMFANIMETLDPEPDADDERRIDLLHRELKNFLQEFELKYCQPQGSA